MNVGRRRSDHEKRARGIGNAIGYRIGGNRGGGFVGNVSTQGGVAVDRLGDSLSKLTAGNNSTRSANEKSQREVVINMEASGEDISKVVPQRAKKVKTGLQSQPYSGGHEKNTKIYQNWEEEKDLEAKSSRGNEKFVKNNGKMIGDAHDDKDDNEEEEEEEEDSPHREVDGPLHHHLAPDSLLDGLKTRFRSITPSRRINLRNDSLPPTSPRAISAASSLSSVRNVDTLVLMASKNLASFPSAESSRSSSPCSSASSLSSASSGISTAPSSPPRHRAFQTPLLQKQHRREKKPVRKFGARNDSAASKQPSFGAISRQSSSGKLSRGGSFSHVCANCGAGEKAGFGQASIAFKPCARCKAAFYCCVKCQMEHWKTGHKEQCRGGKESKVELARKRSIEHSRAKRILSLTPSSSKVSSSSPPGPGAGRKKKNLEAKPVKCGICHFRLAGKAQVELECGHAFHTKCLDEIRAVGVEEPCSMCRKKQPPSPAKNFDDGFDIFYPIKKTVERNDGTWPPLLALQRKAIAETIELWEQAANEGHDLACYYLGVMYNQGRGVRRSQIKAMQWWEKAAERGDVAAQFNLGTLYFHGRNVKQSEETAAKWWEMAAEQGDREAQSHLGYLYENGLGVEQSDARAMQWYMAAAEQGDCDAQCNVGNMYHKGQGVEEDRAEAAKWWLKSAEGGSLDAQYNMGTLYDYGRGVQQSAEKAVEWYEKAAEQGHADAQYNIGHMFSSGHGTEQSDRKAISWWEKAAKQGVIEAQYNLGVIYRTGRGTRMDETKAVKYYKMAAEKGHPQAQYNLGIMIKKGLGAKRNAGMARKWFQKAAAQGLGAAQKILDAEKSTVARANSAKPD